MIETARLTLRPFVENDRGAFDRVLNTPAVMALLGGIVPSDRPNPSFDKRLADQKRDGFSYWAVELRDTAALIGTCGVRLGSNYPGTPVAGMYELGWRLAEPHWGRGLAREAAEATLDWTWWHTDAPLAAAWTTIDNRASWGLMERLGMTRRPDLDFHRPDYAEDDPHGALIVYTLDRPR